MGCRNCNKESTPGRSFCRFCGAALSSATEPPLSDLHVEIGFIGLLEDFCQCREPLRQHTGDCARCGLQIQVTASVSSSKVTGSVPGFSDATRASSEEPLSPLPTQADRFKEVQRASRVRSRLLGFSKRAWIAAASLVMVLALLTVVFISQSKVTQVNEVPLDRRSGPNESLSKTGVNQRKEGQGLSKLADEPREAKEYESNSADSASSSESAKVSRSRTANSSSQYSTELQSHPDIGSGSPAPQVPSASAGQRNVSPETKRPQITIIQPGPDYAPRSEPTRSSSDSYAGPMSGVIVWSGFLQKGAELAIEGKTASFGQINGGLPGRPVEVEITPDDVVASEPPMPSNGWNRLILRSKRTTHSVVTIHWTILSDRRQP